MESTIVSKEQFLRGGPWEMSDILKLPNMQDVLEVLGKENTQAYFDEYVTLHPSVEPISAKDILPHVLEIVGGTEPTYTSLYRRARDPPTDEHWAECLFAYRMKRYLESRECMAINWRSTLLHNPEERRDSRAIAWERYGIILIILERLQSERYIAAFPQPEPEPEPEPKSEPGPEPRQQQRQRRRQLVNPNQETTLSWLDEFLLKWVPRC